MGVKFPEKEEKSYHMLVCQVFPFILEPFPNQSLGEFEWVIRDPQRMSENMEELIACSTFYNSFIGVTITP